MCPVCGLRDETEFSYGGDATVVRPAPDESSPDVWFDYVFLSATTRAARTRSSGITCRDVGSGLSLNETR